MSKTLTPLQELFNTTLEVKEILRNIPSFMMDETVVKRIDDIIGNKHKSYEEALESYRKMLTTSLQLNLIKRKDYEDFKL